MSSSEPSLKDTVFLPKTSFAMRAFLAEQEKSTLAFWNNIDLYQALRKKSKGKPPFVLHFGPPYANGTIHIGHALTYVLKDVLNKLMQMSGYDAPLVPGWDCHGLPIELKVEEKFKAEGKTKDSVPVIEFIQACRAYAKEWIEIQKQDLKRLGIVADWDNPYTTMNLESQAAILQNLFTIVKKGYVYRGLKPVLWSVIEQTALAEAEVEYHDHKSDAIYVSFPIHQSPLPSLQNANIVIWTTTPWSLPGNRAICYHNDVTYVLVEQNNKKFVIAKDLLEQTLQKIGSESSYTILETFVGKDLLGTACHHPLRHKGFTFNVPLFHGEHVTTEVGTGLVHTAPSHGMEDFIVCQTHGIPADETVLGNGLYADEVPFFKGVHVYKVNPLIMESLQEVDALMHHEKIIHSYPHSWRSKAPLIYRATAQWFVKMDYNNLRQKALAHIKEVDWYPIQGERRIQAMVESRPDWCISRQRSWGVPIALFVHKKTKDILQDDQVNGRILSAIQKHGIEAWRTTQASVFLGDSYNPDDYEQAFDIIDVWFDSASTQDFVLRTRPELRAPADVYFEGSDQHRGWFQSSLMVGEMVHDTPPYKTVLTHGFVLDDKGYKMSKSQGNSTSPQQVIQTLGADILRLWIVGSHYTDDLRIGSEILKRQEDIYRRYRNTLRYLLGALDGFEDDEKVDYKDLPELERYILHKLHHINEMRKNCLKDHDFSKYFQALHNFCSHDLSSFYFDVRKDCLYCDKPTSLKRRSTRTVMAILLQHIIKFLAPALTFTAEEAYQHLPENLKEKGAESVHLTGYEDLPEFWHQAELDEKWTTLRHLRKVVTGAIEIERANKIIGSSLQAEVDLFIEPSFDTNIDNIDFAELCIASRVNIVRARPVGEAFKLDDVTYAGAFVKLAEGGKCTRCWKVNDVLTPQQVCKRCDEVLCAS